MPSLAHDLAPDATACPADAPMPVAAILDRISQGVVLLDREGVVRGPQTRTAAALLRCTELVGARFTDLLRPLASDKTQKLVDAALAKWRESADAGDAQPLVLPEIELRLPGPDGAFGTAYYRLEFHAAPADAFAPEVEPPAAGLVLITDATVAVQQARELADLRSELQAQTEILRGVLRLGRARFAASVQKTDTAMSAIDSILKKPAREQAAFRKKLEETLDQVDRIRREGAALKLTALEGAARSFEDALHELRSRPALSGSDFLPLAVKLDDLYVQFALLRAAAKNAAPQARAPEAAPVTDNGTQIIDAPDFIRKLRESREAPAMPRSAPAGSLEKTLATMTLHIAEEHAKKAALECHGLEAVPPPYQATVKNVAIQLIRNALMHGVESAGRRARAGKPPVAPLRLGFKRQPDGGYEMRFQDDGRGVDPVRVRKTAVEKGLLSPADAESLTDRQAIKLIFKAGFTTLPQDAGGPAHGTGLTLVRRYVDEAGGTIALASELGRTTRYKINFPPSEPVL